MDNILKLSASERSELFKETGARRQIAPAIVEKDFWVCWTLKQLFSCPAIGKNIIFKGGTSLSKVFKLIERFSEDIDLILNWNLLTDENPLEIRSNSKQEKLNWLINDEAQMYIREKLLPAVDALVHPVCTAELDKNDGHVLKILYPAAFSENYILPYIKLESGPLAAWQPHETYKIKSYAAEMFPELFSSPDAEVRSIKAERTFWEKITILHQEAHRPESSPQPHGYSRHYYDVFQLAESNVKDSALSDLSLFREVVDFKKKFYPRFWAHYDLAVPGTIRLYPPEHVLHSLAKDYAQMHIMIYGQYPDFEVMINRIKLLEVELNKISP